ncbi:MAG: MerR family transcriptional regulator [Pseudomonadota bacterium]
MPDKAREAFRTISEVANWLDIPAHVLRFWESKFSQIKPVKRAGGRRYYRPADMELIGGIKTLLHDDGLTIRGVQKMLKEEGIKGVAALSPPVVNLSDEEATARRTARRNRRAERLKARRKGGQVPAATSAPTTPTPQVALPEGPDDNNTSADPEDTPIVPVDANDVADTPEVPDEQVPVEAMSAEQDSQTQDHPEEPAEPAEAETMQAGGDDTHRSVEFDFGPDDEQEPQSSDTAAEIGGAEVEDVSELSQSAEIETPPALSLNLSDDEDPGDAPEAHVDPQEPTEPEFDTPKSAGPSDLADEDPVSVDADPVEPTPEAPPEIAPDAERGEMPAESEPHADAVSAEQQIAASQEPAVTASNIDHSAPLPSIDDVVLSDTHTKNIETLAQLYNFGLDHALGARTTAPQDLPAILERAQSIRDKLAQDLGQE